MSNKLAKYYILCAVAIIAAWLGPACGYRVRGAVGRLPERAASIAIPAFDNQSTRFRIEQTITRAVRQEFAARTGAKILDSAGGAALLLTGTVKDVTAVPVTFGSQNAGEQTFGSAFQITVRVAVKLTRPRDAAVIMENNNFVFRERYLLNAEVRDFFAGDNPALERLGHDFAAALVSAVIER